MGPPPMGPPPVGDKQLPSLLSLKVDPPEQLSEQTGEVVLPQVLEEVLALKSQRAIELGTDDSGSGAPVQEETTATPVAEPEIVWEKEDTVV